MSGHLWGASMTTVCQLNVDHMPVLQKMAVTAAKRAGAMLFAVGLAACSTAPDWARPSLIYGDDAAAAAADPTAEKDFPELADVPGEAPAASSREELREAAEGLAADRERARYTDEVLRGGTETPAPAPRTSRPAPVPAPSSSLSAPSTTAGAAPSAPADAGVIAMPERTSRPLPGSGQAVSATEPQSVPAARGAETTEVSVAPAPSAPEMEPVAAAPVEEAPQPAAPAPASAMAAPEPQPQAASRSTRRAAVPPLPEGERMRARSAAPDMDDRMDDIDAAAAAVREAPARQATSARTAMPASRPAATSQTTQNRSRDRFEPSSAPQLAHEALEAAGPVVSSRYGAPVPDAAGTADPEDPVQVNLDALKGPLGPGASLEPAIRADRADAFANMGGPGNIPPYVVNFGHGSIQLNVSDRQKIAQAADAAISQGGIVRVVGHASSRTGDLAVGEHLLANFGVSLDRATAVANELIRNGVDSSKVYVEAKGDLVPVYYESMPAGEAGNRRAEIFIE